MACIHYNEDKGFLGWRMTFRPFPKDNPVKFEDSADRTKSEAMNAWLETDEAKGFYLTRTTLPDDAQQDEFGNRWSERAIYVFTFTDADTAFAFKMRFG